MTTLTGRSVPITITDDQGNVMPGVQVTVTGPNSYNQILTSSTPGGVIQVTGVPIGDYTVTYGTGSTARSFPLPVLTAAAQAQATQDQADANTAGVKAAVKTVNGQAPDASGNVAVAAGGAVSDASTTARGVVQLAGDLGGTAASPTVPGLQSLATAVAGKASSTDSRLSDSRIPTGPAGGALTGTFPSPTLAVQPVTKINGNSPAADGSITIATGGGGTGSFAPRPALTPASPAPSPTVRLSDAMSDTNGTRLQAHSGGISWTEVAGTWTIQSNAATVQTSSPSQALAVFDTSKKTYTLSADMKTTGDSPTTASQAALLYRYGDANNFMLAQFGYPPPAGSNLSNLSLQVYACRAGAFSLLVDVDLTYALPAAPPKPGQVNTLRADVYGPDATFYVNGTEVITITDDANVASTKAGLRAGSGGSPSGGWATFANVKVQDCQAAVRYNWPRTKRFQGGAPLLTRSTTNNVNNATLAGALTAGTSVTSIPTTALTAAVAAGDSIRLTSGGTNGFAIAAAAAAVGGTAIPVRPFTPASAFAVGANVSNFGYDSLDVLAPNLVFDPQQNRYAISYSCVPNDGSQQINMALAYASSPYGPFTKEPANPVYVSGAGAGAGIDGGIVFVNNQWVQVIVGPNLRLQLVTAPALVGPWTLQGFTTDLNSPGAWEAGNSNGPGDPFLRVRQDGTTLECWYGNNPSGTTDRNIGFMTSTDGGVSWTHNASAFLPNNGISVGVSFSASSVYVPPGREGLEYLVTFDIAPRSDATRRSVGQAITVDGGATWHYRVASNPTGVGAEAAQSCDSFFFHEGGRAYLFVSGCLITGLVVGIGGQTTVQSTAWNGQTLIDN